MGVLHLRVRLSRVLPPRRHGASRRHRQHQCNKRSGRQRVPGAWHRSQSPKWTHSSTQGSEEDFMSERLEATRGERLLQGWLTAHQGRAMSGRQLTVTARVPRRSWRTKDEERWGRRERAFPGVSCAASASLDSIPVMATRSWPVACGPARPNDPCPGPSWPLPVLGLGRPRGRELQAPRRVRGWEICCPTQRGRLLP